MKSRLNLLGLGIVSCLLVGCGGSGSEAEPSNTALVQTDLVLTGNGGYRGSTAPIDSAVAKVDVKENSVSVTLTSGDRIMQIDLPVKRLVEGMRFTVDDSRVAGFYFDPTAFVAPDSRLNEDDSFVCENLVLNIGQKNSGLVMKPEMPWTFSRVALGSVDFDLSETSNGMIELPPSVGFSTLNSVYFDDSSSNFGIASGAGTGILVTGANNKLTFEIDGNREIEVNWPATEGAFNVSLNLQANVIVRQTVGNATRVWEGTAGAFETKQNDLFARDWIVSLNRITLSPKAQSGATGSMTLTGAIRGQSPID